MAEAATAIVLRTRDRPLLLGRALDSVLGQTDQDWCLWVVNDGGDPASVEAQLAPRRAAFGDRVQLLHTARSAGMEAASNQALRASRSAFVIIHDDDDRWHPAFLARSTATLAALPDSWGGVVTKSLFVQERIAGATVEEIDTVEFNPNLTQITLAEVATTNQFPPIAFLYRRAALERVGLYREDLPVLGDWEFNLRFLQHFDIALLPEVLAYWHHRIDADGSYRNSTGAPHERVAAQLRNAALRMDLAAGRFGLGELMNRHSVALEQTRRQAEALHTELGVRAHALQAAEQREAAVRAQVQTLEPLVATLQRDVGILQGHIEILNRDVVAVLQRRIDEMDGEARDRDDRLVVAHAEAARLAAELQQSIEREQLAAARAQQHAEGRAAALAVVQDLQRSRSWRLTAPLRTLGRLLRRPG